MLKPMLIGLLVTLSVAADAETANDTNQYNDPTVSSLAASTQQFPNENKITGTKGEKYNTSGEKATNKPLVNSLMYSGSQFPEQNKLSGTKGQEYNAANSPQKNNPTINSRMASSQQFPEQNAFNNDGKTKKKHKASAAN